MNMTWNGAYKNFFFKTCFPATFLSIGITPSSFANIVLVLQKFTSAVFAVSPVIIVREGRASEF